MPFDAGNFLDVLAAAIATAASLNYANANQPRALWRHAAVEGGCTDPYSVLKIYGGSLSFVPVPSCSIQCETIGTGNDATFARAVAVHATLLDGNGRPVRMKAISGYRLNGIDLRAPGLVGRDDKGRAKVVFNFDVKAIATA
jgi:hypothetical protein